MKLPAFLNFRREACHTALVAGADGLSVAGVNITGSRPVIQFCEYLPWGATDGRDKILRQAVSSHHLRASATTTVLDLGSYNMLSVEAPEVPVEELKSAVRWRIKDLIDFHVDDAVIDVFDAPLSGVEGRLNNIYAVVARKSVVQEQVDFLQNCNVNLDAIDIPELVLRNIANYLPGNDAGLVLIYLAADYGRIIIVKNSTLYLARSLDLGFRNFQETVSGEDGLLEASLQDRLILEVQRSLDYYDRYFRQPQVASLVLAPVPMDATRLCESLQENLGIASGMLDANEVFHCSDHLDMDMQSRCLMAIGAALRREQPVL